MQFKKKLIAAAAVICMIGAAIYGSTMEIGTQNDESSQFSLFQRKKTIYFWYSDDSMTDYINSAAVAFGEAKGVRVIPQLTSESEYLEAVNEASLRSDHIPDVIMISNDSLGKAYLAGLASEVTDPGGILNPDHFPEAALSAVTYQGKYVAYPLYFETSALVYNETYLEAWAAQQLEAASGGSGEDGELDEEEAAAQEAAPQLLTLEEYMAEAVPDTVDDILNIANTFDVPEGVEGVMKWDVSDIFYNYWFVGNYMVAGGDAGDDINNINIDNQETIQCLEVYQALNQFFSIESDTVTYDSVVQDFIDGKIVFTIATTDVVKILEEAKANGGFAYDYGIVPVPDVSEALKSRSLSVTGTIAVNGYSQEKELANEFAAFLTNEYTADLYGRTGKVSANLAANTDNGALQAFMEEYAGSIPLPKMIETSNFWIQLEVLFSKVWNGSDAQTLAGELSNQILIQVGR